MGLYRNSQSNSEQAERRHRFTTSVNAALLVLAMYGSGAIASNHTPSTEGGKDPSQAYATLLTGAQKLGEGALTAYRKEEYTLLAIPKPLFGRLLFWYSEVVSLPAGTTSQEGLAIGSSVVTLERHGKQVMIRDHTSRYSKRTGVGDPTIHQEYRPKIKPIQLAVGRTTRGSIVAVLPIVAEDPDGVPYFEGLSAESVSVDQPVRHPSIKSCQT